MAHGPLGRDPSKLHETIAAARPSHISSECRTDAPKDTAPFPTSGPTPEQISTQRPPVRPLGSDRSQGCSAPHRNCRKQARNQRHEIHETMAPGCPQCVHCDSRWRISIRSAPPRGSRPQPDRSNRLCLHDGRADSAARGISTPSRWNLTSPLQRLAPYRSGVDPGLQCVHLPQLEAARREIQLTLQPSRHVASIRELHQ